MSRTVFVPGRTELDALYDPMALTVGEATIPRFPAATTTLALATGTLRLAYFTAKKSELVSSVRLLSAGTAAAATPTLVRAGLYSAAADGSVTLIGSIANDTAIFAAANTAYTRSLTTPVQKTAGQRYALGVLVVTAGTAPTVATHGGNLPSSEFAVAPRLSASLNSQTDLPASVAAGSLAASNSFYGVVLP